MKINSYQAIPGAVSAWSRVSVIIKTRPTLCWITQEHKFDRDQAKAHDHTSAERARAHDTEPAPILRWLYASCRGADDT